MKKYKEKENRLKLIPKAENYCTYIINVIIKLPRTEKFSIGTEYKKSVYQMINYIMYLNKIKNTNKEKTLKLYITGEKKWVFGQRVKNGLKMTLA